MSSDFLRSKNNTVIMVLMLLLKTLLYFFFYNFFIFQLHLISICHIRFRYTAY